MTRILKISINFIFAISFSITFFSVTVGTAQNNPFESYKLNISDKADYRLEMFNDTWYLGAYGTPFPKQDYLYDHINYFDYGFPGGVFIRPWLWISLKTFTQSEFPYNTNSATAFIYRSSYIQSIYSGLPLGCHPILEQKTCVSRGACHIPLYCPSYFSNFFIDN